MSVGPRVTPNFVKPREWNAQTTYHFFDAVRDTAGSAYIATKPVVPAGTPLTDEGYWFLWADPDPKFDELNETVKTFNQRITQNTDDIATKAPISHASTATTYGVGSSTNYGHVKLYNAVGTQSERGHHAQRCAVCSCQHTNAHRFAYHWRLIRGHVRPKSFMGLPAF